MAEIDPAAAIRCTACSKTAEHKDLPKLYVQRDCPGNCAWRLVESEGD